MSRMKDAFQKWQQIQEDAIQRLEDIGWSREAAIRLLDTVEGLHRSGIVPRMHKEEPNGFQEDETGA